jgi:hypothetical protein
MQHRFLLGVMHLKRVKSVFVSMCVDPVVEKRLNMVKLTVIKFL